MKQSFEKDTVVSTHYWQCLKMKNPSRVKINSSLRSSQQGCSIKRGALRNFTKFTGKHQCQSLFINKVVRAASNFIEKEALAEVLSCEFCKSFNNTFFKRT